MKTRDEIVVGYDGSDEARRALLTACELADPQAAVTVVHALDVPPHLAYFERFEAAAADLAQRLEKSAREVVGGKALQVNFLTVVGEPATVLADVGRQRSAGIIVVGSRGLGPLRSTTSSVSQRLLRRASCPVMVVPKRSGGTSTNAAIRRRRRHVSPPVVASG